MATAGELPSGAVWAVEFKWDGYRGVAYCQGDRVRMLSRNQLELIDRFPELRVLRELLHGRTVVLDGEIVALGSDQRPDFGLLQRRTRSTVGVRALRVAPRPRRMPCRCDAGGQSHGIRLRNRAAGIPPDRGRL
ncbi:hypothetical protein [Saccharothrix carnea]|nr:hypothetical protein [Saccharothrix carnea]